MTLPAGYYAVPDPDNADVITYWHASDDDLTPWPRNAKYGPVLYRRDVPKKQPERNAVREAFWGRRRAWHETIRQLITADLDAARALFAGDTIRCYECGRVLTDDTSRRLGVGPECRRPPGPHYSEEEIRQCIATAVEVSGPADAFRKWTWTRPLQGRVRKRETVTVTRYADTVPRPGYSLRDAACCTVLDRLNTGRPLCTGPVVWEVYESGDGLAHRRWFCDADMPADYRPPGSDAEANPDVLFS